MNDLQSIPGIGPVIARYLMDLGFFTVGDLRGQDPDRMYHDLREFRGTQVDRCVLYVFRSAVYFASVEKHEPGLLKWWNWRDEEEGEGSVTR